LNTPSRANKAIVRVHLVHPPTKKFSDLNEIWYVDRDWWVVHNSVPFWPDPRSRSRSQRSESCENGQVYLLHWYAT